MVPRRIYTQGDYDGACFLYALANAYTALTDCTPSCLSWDRGVQKIPNAIDFLGGCVGTTGSFAVESARLEQAADIMLNAFAESGSLLERVLVAGVTDIREMIQLIGSNSVVVFRYRGQTAHVDMTDHWVCGVAVTTNPFKLHLACSFRHSQDGRLNDQLYRELYHENCNRYSNNYLADHHKIEVVPLSVFKISLAG